MTLQRNRSAVRRFSRLLKFSSLLQRIPDRVVPAPFRLMQIGSAFWQSRALYVAARLDVATLLGDEKQEIDKIAAQLGVDEMALYRLMRMLASTGIFTEHPSGTFFNNRLSSPLRTDVANSIQPMILMHNSMEMSKPWFDALESGVRSGKTPFLRTHGCELFDYMDRHPEFDGLFSHAMDSMDALLGDSFSTDFDWGQFRRIIDVGGSKGAKSIAILKRYPELEAIVVDREQVISAAQQHWSGEGAEVLSRIQFKPGNVFDSLPGAQDDKDIYLLSAVLHSFSDDLACRALKNLANTCVETGARIALLELIMPADRPDRAMTSVDMQMFVGTSGRERTAREWQKLYEMSGLCLDETVHLRSLGSIQVLMARNSHLS